MRMVICRRLDPRGGYVSFRLPHGHGYTGLVNNAGTWEADDVPKLMPEEVAVDAERARAKAVLVVFDLDEVPGRN